MLILRKEQMDAFQKTAEEQFQMLVVDYLSERFPEDFGQLSSDRQLRFLDTSMKRAATYDLNGELDFARFAEAGVRLGIEFDTTPDNWAAAIMQDTAMGSPTERIGYIVDKLGATDEA